MWLAFAWCPLPASAARADLILALDNSGSDEMVVLPALDDVVVVETATLPALPGLGADPQTPAHSGPKQSFAQAGTHIGAATPAAALNESLGLREIIPSPAAEAGDRSGKIVLPAWLAALIAAAFLGVVLVAVLILIRRRRSADKELPQDQIPKAFLNDLGGVTDRPSYELGESLTVVGRIKGSDANRINYVTIPEPTIGRRHALIEFKKHCFWVADQNSLNGTFINNKRVEGDTRLKHGDRIRFHKHEFEFLLLDMFETDGTMMGQTVFADGSRAVTDGDGICPEAARNSNSAISTIRGS